VLTTPRGTARGTPRVAAGRGLTPRSDGGGTFRAVASATYTPRGDGCSSHRSTASGYTPRQGYTPRDGGASYRAQVLPTMPMPMPQRPQNLHPLNLPPAPPMPLPYGATSPQPGGMGNGFGGFGESNQYVPGVPLADSTVLMHQLQIQTEQQAALQQSMMATALALETARAQESAWAQETARAQAQETARGLLALVGDETSERDISEAYQAYNAARRAEQQPAPTSPDMAATWMQYASSPPLPPPAAAGYGDVDWNDASPSKHDYPLGECNQRL